MLVGKKDTLSTLGRKYSHTGAEWKKRGGREREKGKKLEEIGRETGNIRISAKKTKWM